MNIIFKPFNGKENRPHLITDLPKKPICLGKGFCCDNRRCDALAWKEKLLHDAVPFREEDRDNIIHLCMTKSEWIAFNNGRTWQPDPEKIYSVDGKYNIETPNWIHHKDKFAVLLIKDESHDCIGGHNYRCKCEGRCEDTFEEHEKIESQNELLQEIGDLINNSPDEWISQDSLIEIGNKFHISRIKPE